MFKNSQYSYDYHQPEEYRFSLDSVFMPQKVAQILLSENIVQSELGQWQVMDLCAGCGVIGMELQFHLKNLLQIDFLEVQESYRSYFEQNLNMIADHRFRFLNMNYNQLKKMPEFKEKYDLILSNPPYFFKGEGLLSPNDFKNRCRFFLDSDFSELLIAIDHILKEGARAFMLVRPGSHHGRDHFEEMNRIIAGNNLRLTAKIIDEIRGTHIVCLIKEI